MPVYYVDFCNSITPSLLQMRVYSCVVVCEKTVHISRASGFQKWNQVQWHWSFRLAHEKAYSLLLLLLLCSVFFLFLLFWFFFLLFFSFYHYCYYCCVFLNIMYYYVLLFLPLSAYVIVWWVNMMRKNSHRRHFEFPFHCYFNWNVRSRFTIYGCYMVRVVIHRPVNNITIRNNITFNVYASLPIHFIFFCCCSLSFCFIFFYFRCLKHMKFVQTKRST